MPRTSFRFYYSENTTANQFNPTLGSMDGFPNTITAARGSFITNYQERLNYDRTLTPTLLLHFGAGLYHQSFVDNSPDDLISTRRPRWGSAGFLVNRNFPEFQGNCTAGITSGTCSNATGGLANLGPPGQGPSYEMRPTGTVNLTWVRGKHTYKAGAEMDLRTRLFQTPPRGYAEQRHRCDFRSLREHEQLWRL